jgi:hypothetical protein
VLHVNKLRLYLFSFFLLFFATGCVQPVVSNIEKETQKQVDILVSNYIDVNYVDEYGMTPIMNAIKDGEVNKFKVLLDKGSNLNFLNKNQENSIILAVKYKRLDILEYILRQSNSYNIDHFNNDGKNALMIASDFSNTSIGIKIIQKLILSGGASIDKENLDGTSFIKYIISNNNIRIKKLVYSLSKHPLLKNSQNNSNFVNVKKIKNSNSSIDLYVDDIINNNSNEKSYAVIIGVEDYMLETSVNYSINSAKLFKKYVQKVLNVPEEQILEFSGKKTSSGFIKSQLDDFLSLIEKDAILYFYYSGHGVPDNNGNAYILPSDTDAETIKKDKTFMLGNIYSKLSKTKSKRVFAFIDSCFSGKDDNGKLLFSGVAPVLKVKKVLLDKNKMTVFTAGSSKHFSNQYKEEKHRLFSYYLMEGLSKNKLSIEELFSYVRKKVANKSRALGDAYYQVPQIIGNTKGSIK